MQVYGQSGRYARALYNISKQKNAVDALETDFNNFMGVWNQSDKFRQFLTDLSVSPNVHRKGIDDFTKEAKSSDEFKNFLCVVTENRAQKEMSKIHADFQALANGHRGKVTATVTSARPLSSAQIKDMSGAINSFLGGGYTLSLDVKVSKDLIAGFMVDVLDNRIDLSLSSKIKKLQSVLEKPL